jgi:hypothetical protein
MPPTFNFLAGNQEAEENKALIWVINQSPEGPPFRGRTYRTDGPGNSQKFQRRPKLERLGMHINKPTRTAEVHVGLPKTRCKEWSQSKDEPNI